MIKMGAMTIRIMVSLLARFIINPNLKMKNQKLKFFRKTIYFLLFTFYLN